MSQEFVGLMSLMLLAVACPVGAYFALRNAPEVKPGRRSTRTRSTASQRSKRGKARVA